MTCAGAPVRCVRRHTCHWGDPHPSLQDIHRMKVKTKLHHLLFIKTPPFNAAICQLEERMFKAFRQKMGTLTEDNTDLCFFTCDDLPPDNIQLLRLTPAITCFTSLSLNSVFCHLGFTVKQQQQQQNKPRTEEKLIHQLAPGGEYKKGLLDFLCSDLSHLATRNCRNAQTQDGNK